MRLTLRTSERVLGMIPFFNRFLAAYSLKIVGQEVNEKAGTVELKINTKLLKETQLVTVLAKDLFDASEVLYIKKDSGELTPHTTAV